MTHRFDDFKVARRWNALNRFLQIVLSISLVLLLNALASRSGVHWRWHVGAADHRLLAIETVKSLEMVARRAPQGGSEPWVRVYNVLADSGAGVDEAQAGGAAYLRKQLEPMLDDFLFAAQKTAPAGWLSVERVDRMRNAGARADLLSQNPGLELSDAVALVIVCKDKRFGKEPRRKLISTYDICRYRENGEPDAFRGEEALVSALLDVTSETPQIVYLTSGHGEMSTADMGERGLSSLELKLRARNIPTLPLDLARVNEVPTNASLVLIAAPRQAFTPAEVDKLRRYMRERNGRLVALIDPGASPGLEDLFYDWGVFVDNARAWDASPDAADTKGNLLVRISGVSHGLTKLLAGHGQLALGRARAVFPDPGSPPDDTLHVTQLAGTTPDPKLSWGERDHATMPYRNNPERGDLPPPVGVVTVAERAAGLRMNLKLPGGRMLVAGSGAMAGNALIDSNNNAFFLLNTINWMLDREQLLNIPPRPLPDYKLDATWPDLKRVAWRFALIPAVVALLGLCVYFWRHNT
ncbi:MAG: GldG family protein [Puniceicoccales bacterium]|jgi:hypothetical protein|nr:GldG family protein [Puniceicoccales bacterium]